MEGDGAEIRRVLKSMKITDVQVKIAEEELDRLMAGFREWAKSEFTPEAIKTRERVKRAIT